MPKWWIFFRHDGGAIRVRSFLEFLISTFRRNPIMFAGMDSDDAALFHLLADKIGFIMEDTAPVALSMRRRHGVDLKAGVQKITEGVTHVNTLCQALNVIAERRE